MSMEVKLTFNIKVIEISLKYINLKMPHRWLSTFRHQFKQLDFLCRELVVLTQIIRINSAFDKQ